MVFIDLTSYRCPLPLVKVKLALKQLAVGEQLQVVLSDPGSRMDVPRFLKNQGHGLQELYNDANRLTLRITKSA
ncbi:sulfurtransferase TusA family protein [Shewanella sp. AS16]|uniref:sulfurtransferase TusA family protein n=1 Tax=Shewanella sp. AS16 TaxID=2907625 RepID=UPI001F3D67E3|nr:sulfurtransferase TusA family protein [Shewanella sp. AS16]MCE9684650.1 sulfurtransferase TusA family protein [Shewanella sp. AS16]